MAENTRMKDIQADIKRMTDTLTSHNTQFLKAGQTFELMSNLLLGHNDCFIKVKQTLDSFVTFLHEHGEATTSHSSHVDGSNFHTSGTHQASPVLKQHPHMKVEIPKFSSEDAMQWLYKDKRFFSQLFHS